PEVRRQPLLRVAQRPALAPRIVGDLLLVDAADDEVLRLRMREVPARHRRARPHREALGELDAGVALRVDQLPQRRLLRMLWACRIAGRRADAFVLLADQRLV